MSRKPQILLVDDDPDLGPFVKHQLQQEGWQVHYIDSPLKAARMLRAEHFDILLTDMNMPLVSGLELVMWTKKHAPRTKSMIMTSMPIEMVKIMAQEAGVLGIFSKPLDVQGFKDHVEQELQTGLSGKIRHINLLDLLNVMLMDKVNREIQIHDKNKNRQAFLSLYQGDVIHAAIYDLESEDLLFDGESAFYEILKIRNGSFSEKTYNPDLIKNIEVPFQNLSLESARILDEQQSFSMDVDNTYLNNIDKIRRIMLVDDDETIRLLIKTSLEKQGFEVITFGSAVNASLALSNEERPLQVDLIITDVSMPEMSGIDFMLWLKARHIPCPVIVMTAFHSPEIEEQARQNKVVKYLNKPIKLHQLEMLLAEIGNTGFEGVIENINVFDFIQLTVMSGERKHLLFQADANSPVGHIYIENGRFLHAHFEEHTGEQAFLEIINIGRGLFQEGPWVLPSQLTLSEIPTHKLFLNATRMLDQKNAFWPGSESLIAEIERKVEGPPQA